MLQNAQEYGSQRFEPLCVFYNKKSRLSSKNVRNQEFYGFIYRTIWFHSTSEVRAFCNSLLENLKYFIIECTCRFFLFLGRVLLSNYTQQAVEQGTCVQMKCLLLLLYNSHEKCENALILSPRCFLKLTFLDPFGI